MNKYIMATIAVLVLIIAGQTYYFYREIEAVRFSNKICAKDIGGVREAVKQLGARFETTDVKTIDALIATYDRLDSAIKTYDENVQIYNAQIADLNRRVNGIINYLSQ